MKGPVTSHRESCLHQARVYLAQARSFGKRRSPFAFTLLEWAASARRRAQGAAAVEVDREQFGPWWRTPKGIVIKYDQCGYNGVQCFSTPIGWAQQTQREKRHGRQYLWHQFVIDFGRVPAFLGRCEYLGKDEPTAEILAQIDRFSRDDIFTGAADGQLLDDNGDDEQPEPAGQLELFA